MKKMIVYLLIAGFCSVSFAQKAETNERQESVIEKRLSRINAELNLTDDQKVAVRKILEYDAEQKMKLREQQEGNREATRQAHQELMEQTQNQIKNQLTEEQQQKYSAFISKRKERTPEMQQMIERLDLSDEQIEQLTPILVETGEKIRSVRESSRRRQARRQMRNVMEERDKKIEAILTEDQKKEFKKLKDERRKEMRDGMGERRRGRRR